METESHDINLFKIGQCVDIAGVKDMENVKINHISDSGVTIYGKNCGTIVISGKSPAYLHIEKKKDLEIKQFMDTNTESNNAVANETETESKKIRASYKDKMKNVQLPQKGNFTIKEVAELNDIPLPYATNWVKQNCVESGKVEKKEGQRGRVASLYKKK